MLYDIDFGMGLFSNVEDNYIPGATSKGPPSAILRKLLENTEYKTLFINRIADLLNTTFLSSRSLSLLNETKAMYAPLMQEHIARWKLPTSVSAWEQNVTRVENYVNLRGTHFRNHIRESFNANLANTTITINVNDAAQGYVQVNSMNILPSTDGVSASPYPWTGVYFQNNPMKLTAVAKTGFHFERWEKAGISVSLSPELAFTATTPTLDYKAVFAAGALPVVLKSLSAKKQGGTVAITWETTSETNNDYFVVERSENAMSWQPLVTIKGAATIQALQQYHTTDEQPLIGMNYYRLKQVDFDQTATYSRMVSIDMGDFKINGLWPNPVGDVLNVKLNQPLQQAEYEITDINGTVVRKLQQLTGTHPTKISVDNLPAGIYLVKIKTKDGASHSGRFVKP